MDEQVLAPHSTTVMLQIILMCKNQSDCFWPAAAIQLRSRLRSFAEMRYCCYVTILPAIGQRTDLQLVGQKRTVARLSHKFNIVMTESEIFAQLFSHKWPSPQALVEFAIRRHGYGGDDGYYGVTYPSDLDKYQRVVEGELIPDGYVEVNYWDGTHRELQVPEQHYVGLLKKHLISLGHDRLTTALDSLL